MRTSSGDQRVGPEVGRRADSPTRTDEAAVTW